MRNSELYGYVSIMLNTRQFQHSILFDELSGVNKNITSVKIF